MEQLKTSEESATELFYELVANSISIDAIHEAFSRFEKNVRIEQDQLTRKGVYNDMGIMFSISYVDHETGKPKNK